MTWLPYSARCAVASLLLAAAPVLAQTDTARQPPLFTWRDAILAGAIGGASIFVCYGVAFLIIDWLIK